MMYSNWRDFNTISYNKEMVRKKSSKQRYRSKSPSILQNQMVQHKQMKQINKIAKSLNLRMYPSLDKSFKIEQKNNQSKSRKKKLFSIEIPKTTRDNKIKNENQSINFDMLKGEGYYTNNRFYRRNYAKSNLVIPADSSKSKRVIPIQFEEQLKQVNKTFIKQNLHEWMRYKKQDVLNKVSEQIKLKSEFQKFLPF